MDDIWAPGIPGNLEVKSELPPRSGSGLEVVEPQFFSSFKLIVSLCKPEISSYWGYVSHHFLPNFEFSEFEVDCRS